MAGIVPISYKGKHGECYTDYICHVDNGISRQYCSFAIRAGSAVQTGEHAELVWFGLVYALLVVFHLFLTVIIFNPVRPLILENGGLFRNKTGQTHRII